MANVNVGAKLRGEDDEEQPLKSIVSGAGTALNRSIFDDPASRSALLQIGLNLMQPQAMGQTFGGHLAQGVGSGGEAVGRIAEEDLEIEKERNRAIHYEEMARVAQQNADTRKANIGKEDRLTSAQIGNLERSNNAVDIAERNRRRTAIKSTAADIDKRVNGYVPDLPGKNMEEKKKNPLYVKYYGKTPKEIEKMVEAEDIEENGPIPDIPGKVTPKPPIRFGRGGGTGGATTAPPRQAPDGNWYVPNPNKPGKFLMVDPPTEE